MSLLAPAALGLAALALPLLALYMLRTRRRPHTVSSLMLWDPEEESVSAAVPWQRLRITPLLILQLLILATFVFLLARPFFEERTLLTGHTVFVMDTSGSMAFGDRFEAARTEALRLVEDASIDSVVSIIDGGPNPRVVRAFTDDPTTLTETITGMQPSGGMEELTVALSLARGLATPDRPTSILLFSDGGIAELSGLEEPVAGVTHLRFGDTGSNLAVTALSGSLNDEGQSQLFLELSNFSDEVRDAVVDIFVDGLLVTSREMSMASAGRARDAFAIDAAAGQTITALLRSEAGDDDLPLDDTRHLVLGRPPVRSVVIGGEGSVFLSALVDALPDYVTATTPTADILIADGGSPSVIDGPTWLIRPPNGAEGIEITGAVQNTAVTFQRPGEPILDGVDLSELVIGEAQTVQSDSWLPLVSAGDVPLILLGDVGGHRVVYFTFDITESNLPVQIAFPILGARLLDWLGGGNPVTQTPEPAGTPFAVVAPVGATGRVTTPGGQAVTVTGEVFTNTGEPGVYNLEFVSEDGSVTAGPRIARQFDANESAGIFRDLETVALAGATEETTSSITEWAPWLLGLLVLTFLVEWWIGHQRPGWRSRAEQTDESQKTKVAA